MKGPKTLTSIGYGYGNNGVYGTLGVAHDDNVPGGRDSAVSWTSDDGQQVWLFGGEGYLETGSYGWLSDLWMFNVAGEMWGVEVFGI